MAKTASDVSGATVPRESSGYPTPGERDNGLRNNPEMEFGEFPVLKRLEKRL
jgi:hypothetical protein